MNDIRQPDPVVTTTDERLRRELEEQGMDEDFIAEAQAQMQDAMDEMGCS
jgi:hypothetical protein